MLQLRPTFSESWYRVVNLRPRLRGTAQISRQYYRGERWYVVRDPAGNQYHRLSDAAYRFIGLLDGKRTVGEAWDLVGGQLADDAPTQPEVIQILSQLYAANLVETDVPPDAQVLLRRHKMQLKRQWQSRLMNLMFPRIPIWDPDRFLKLWLPVCKVFFSKFGAILWLLVVGAAVVMAAPHWKELYKGFENSLQIGQNPENIFWLFVSFWVLKFFHELGHAFATRRFGGECHEMGIMFLVFVPTPYVDASSAWAFPNKWARMFVGAGGMIVELFLAAIAIFIWLNVKDSGGVLPLFLVNVIFWASFTTVLFNANPLLRYDGYYMLSDYLELPNLQQRSREYSLGLIKRHVFKIKPTQPLPTPMARFWLFTYNIFSSIYRIIVGLTIILYVTFQIPILGVLMGISGVVTWIAMPIGKLFKYLALDPELHRKRVWPIIFSSVVAASIVGLIGLLPVPVRVRGEGVLDPAEKAVLYARTPGFIDQVVARNGQRLKKDDVILICANRELEVEIRKTSAELEKTRAQLIAAGVEDTAQAQAAQEYLQSQQKYLTQLQTRKERLVVKSPIDGFLVAPDIENFVGKFIPEGQQVAVVQETQKLRVKGIFTQDDGELVYNVLKEDPNRVPEVKLAGDIEWRYNAHDPLKGSWMTVFNAATGVLPHPLMGQAGGGEAMVDPRDNTGVRSAEGHFEFRVGIENASSRYVPGQRAYVRMKIMNRPLAWQAARYVMQLIQKRTGESQWM
jgi:putative peptide zinc metalloprotease protein